MVGSSALVDIPPAGPSPLAPVIVEAPDFEGTVEDMAWRRQGSIRPTIQDASSICRPD